MHLRRNTKGELEYSPDGQGESQVVKPIRCFPWHDPERLISLRGKGDKEVVLLEALADLAEEDARLIREELDQVFFVPRIQRVRSVTDVFGVYNWRVETDRGEAEFDVKTRDDIHLITDERVLIKDADGSFYEIPHVPSLNAQSRTLLETFV